jgi:hypothetical protein
MPETTLRYGRGNVAPGRLQLAVDQILAELEETPNLPERITIREDGQAIDPFTAGLLVGIVGNVASHYLIRTLEEVVWPRVRLMLGDDAIGDREEGTDPQAKD